MFKIAMFWLAAGFSVWGFYLYARFIVKKIIRPNLASWLVWAALDIILLLGMIFKHSDNSQIWVATVGACVTVVLCLRYGEIIWGTIDIICLIGGMVGCALWVITKDPLWAIRIPLLANLVGTIPTWTSVYNNPDRENIRTWAPGVISSICAMLSVKEPSFATLAQPIVFAFIAGSIIILIILRKTMKEKGV